MLNSLRWTQPTSFSGVIDQLTRMTDAQTSPLIATMRSVKYQGEARRPSQALTDTLVRKAQGLLGASESEQTQAPDADPLDKSFVPLLALLVDANASTRSSKKDDANSSDVAAYSGVSLSRVLTADTTVRLKLQQIQSSPDAQSMARALAQAVFQGKLSDLSLARNDAALTAVSLGAQWIGFGQTMFVQPLDAACPSGPATRREPERYVACGRCRTVPIVVRHSLSLRRDQRRCLVRRIRPLRAPRHGTHHPGKRVWA
jgi:type VI secretion system protein ImpL